MDINLHDYLRQRERSLNFEERYLSISEFLSEHTPLWQREVLNDYPRSFESYSLEWIELLDSRSDRELWSIDGMKSPEALQGSKLYDFILKCQKISTVPAQQTLAPALPPWAYAKVKKKKCHEINSIRAHLEHFQSRAPFKKVIDIGGGVGHLARILGHYHGLNTTCLDQNKDFLQKGNIRKKKYPLPEGAGKVELEHFQFSNDKSIEYSKKLNQYFNNETFTVGLHTCGPLALEHIRSFDQSKASSFLNFGCCYSKLNLETDINLSSVARKSPIPYTLYALTLATRSHSTITFEQFKLKERVKSYRYSLHLYLKDELGFSDFVTIGEAHPRVYWGDFSEYVLLKLKQLNHLPLPSKKELDLFY